MEESEFRVRDEEWTEQAAEIPFEDVEKMVDEALALPPAGEFNNPVSPFFKAFAGTKEVTDKYIYK